jgi:ribonuclease HI
MRLSIYTDGACYPNPGVGAYCAIITNGKEEHSMVRKFQHTTNNRMELLAVIEPLEALKKIGYMITIYTDSQYVANPYNKKWMKGWIKRGWVKADKKPVLNIDLWKRLNAAMEKHTVHFEWVRGHNGHPQNERCDQLAVKARSNPKFPCCVDTEYKNGNGAETQ